jgi:hypothetical protein
LLVQHHLLLLVLLVVVMVAVQLTLGAMVVLEAVVVATTDLRGIQVALETVHLHRRLKVTMAEVEYKLVVLVLLAVVVALEQLVKTVNQVHKNKVTEAMALHLQFLVHRSLMLVVVVLEQTIQ